MRFLLLMLIAVVSSLTASYTQFPDDPRVLM